MYLLLLQLAISSIYICLNLYMCHKGIVGKERIVLALKLLLQSIAVHTAQFMGMAFLFGTFMMYADTWFLDPIHPITYTLCAAVLLYALSFIQKILGPKFETSAETPCTSLAKRRFFGTLYSLAAILLPTAAAIVWAVSYRLVLWLGNMGADQFVYTVSAGGGDSTAETEAEMFFTIILPAIVALIIGFAACFIKRNLKLTLKNKVIQLSAKRLRLIYMLATSLCLAFGLVYAFNVLPLTDVMRAYLVPSTYFEDNYVEPSRAILHFPKQKRNVLHIYMESFENSYFDKANGGYMKENLAPDLLELSKEGISFSDSELMGGPWETVGATHSVAAMVNYWAGVPLKSITKSDKWNNYKYPNFLSLGDIYAAEGYNEEFMLGANVNWGNLGDYYHAHGNFKIFDYTYAKKHKYIPEDYREWWGYEDDKLYAWAKDELTALSKESKPFYFVLENADTHRPDGYVSKNMKEKPFDKQYSNVIHYSQKEVVNFVRWVQKQPWYKNTTIIITGDHRSMDQDFFTGWDPKYKRSVFNLILNSAVTTDDPNILYNRQYAPFDYFPTILRASGVEIDGDRLGLGTDLFSGKKTLIERDGKDKVDDQLSLLSSFYSAYPESEYK